MSAAARSYAAALAARRRLLLPTNADVADSANQLAHACIAAKVSAPRLAEHC